MDRLSNDVGDAAANEFGARLRRRWHVVLLGLLLGLAAGAALLALQPREYTSTTVVLVAPVSDPTGAGRTSEISLDTEAQLVGSAQVADAARQLMRTQDGVAELLDRLDVTVPANSSVLSITFTGESAKGAQEGSHAFAQAYLTNRAREAKAQVDTTVAGLQTQLEAAQEQLQSITDKSASLVEGSPDRVYADAERNVVISQITDLTSRLAPLQIGPPAPGQIITDAPLPQRASAPIPALLLGGGLVLGLLLGLVAALLLDRRDQRVSRPSDVSRHVALPVLAELPNDRSSRGLLGDGATARFDRLRNSLVGSDASITALQVSDLGGAGSSGLVALQLARSFVRSRGEATLIVAHAGSPVPGALGCSDGPGLSDVLRGQITAQEARVRVPELPGLTIIPPGRFPEELEALLQSGDTALLLEGAVRDSRATIVETLGVDVSAAAQAVAARSQALVLVAERGRTTGPALREAADAAALMGAPAAGVVLVSRSKHDAAPGRSLRSERTSASRRLADQSPASEPETAGMAATGAGGSRHGFAVDKPTP